MRLWDLRTPACQGILNTPGPACASFDQQVRSPLAKEGCFWAAWRPGARAELNELCCCWQVLPLR